MSVLEMTDEEKLDKHTYITHQEAFDWEKRHMENAMLSFTKRCDDPEELEVRKRICTHMQEKGLCYTNNYFSLECLKKVLCRRGMDQPPPLPDNGIDRGLPDEPDEGVADWMNVVEDDARNNPPHRCASITWKKNSRGPRKIHFRGL